MAKAEKALEQELAHVVNGCSLLLEEAFSSKVSPPEVRHPAWAARGSPTIPQRIPALHHYIGKSSQTISMYIEGL